MSFGSNLKNLRTSKNLSQLDLAKALQVSQKTISNYEADTREPNFERLKILADMLQCSVDFLLDRESPQDFHLSLGVYIKELDDEVVDFYIHRSNDLVMDSNIFKHIQGLISEVIKQNRNKDVDKR